MRKIVWILCICLGCTWLARSSEPVTKLRTKDFSVYVREGDRGLQFKLGMEDEMRNSPYWHTCDFGRVEDKPLSSMDFNTLGIKRSTEGGTERLTCDIRHKRMPLEVSVEFSAYGSTGTLVRKVKLRNVGTNPMHIENIPSLDGIFSPDEYAYSYMSVSWSNERKLHTSPLGQDTVSFVSKEGRSSATYSPWVCLRNKGKDVYYVAQLAWSGNWYMNLWKDNTSQARLQMGEYFDNGELVLAPGREVILPEVALSGAYGSMDRAANNLHAYQREYAFKKQPDQMPLLVQFNSWFPLQQTITAENLIPLIDRAGELGCESFTIDAGWFTKNAWDREAGDWQTNKRTFPQGLGVIADHVRSKGMRFGLWFELESLGDQSDMLKRHPDWCLQYDGRPVMAMNRAHLDYSKPEVFEWALGQFDAMYKECNGIEWVKLDYNISIGSEFETAAGLKSGDCLRKHIFAYYDWLDTLQVRYPHLLIENCSSGAMRLDLGVAKHTHTSFISDETSPDPSLGMAWSSTLEYIPRALNHWVVGMGNHDPVIDQSLPKGYWDFMFKIPMNGQFGVSSRILDWGPELWQCALDNIKLYKRIRHTIADADCYHLTGQPDYKDSRGWMALQYVNTSSGNSLLMAYRTRCEDPDFTAKLQGLNSNGRYKVSIEGVAKGVYTGRELERDGLRIHLDEEYRACVVELDCQK